MRLFIAVNLDTKMKQLVRHVQNSFRRQNVRGNYTPDENLHLTLAFIGEYGDPDAVLEAMESVGFSPFVITMDKVCCFENLWWAGVDDSKALDALSGKLRRALAEAEIPFDRKKFSPQSGACGKGCALSPECPSGQHEGRPHFSYAVNQRKNRYDLYGVGIRHGEIVFSV